MAEENEVTSDEKTEQVKVLEDLKTAYEKALEHDVKAYLLITIDSKGKRTTGITVSRETCGCCLSSSSLTLLGVLEEVKQKILNTADSTLTLDRGTAGFVGEIMDRLNDSLDKYKEAFETPQEAAQWLDTPLDSHGSKTPVELMKKGEIATVKTLLDELTETRESLATKGNMEPPPDGQASSL